MGNELQHRSTESLLEQLIEVSVAIEEERSIGQITPCWRQEKEVLIEEIVSRTE